MARRDYFCSESIRDGLRGKTVRGGIWTTGAQAATVAVGIGSQSVLARLLDQADFGLMGMVAVVTNFGLLIANAGLSMATVQREEITSQQATNLFWLALALGLVTALGVTGLSPAVAWFYGYSELQGITIALASTFVLSALTLQHQALLRRTLQFRALATIQVLASIASQSAAILWAWNHYGLASDYWALVFTPIVSSVVVCVGSWAACHWRPGLPKRGAGTYELVDFGANLTGFNLVNFLSRNADKTLIGWRFGADGLGPYHQAYRMLLFPLQNVSAPLTAVMVPALSRVAHDKDALEGHYLRVLRALLITLTPMLLAVAITSRWWVGLVLGWKWESATSVFAWLALVGVLQPITNSISPLFIAQGRADQMLRWSLIGTPIALVSFVVGLPWAATGVAAAYALSGVFLRFPLLLWWVHRQGVFDSKKIIRELLLASPALVAACLSNLALAAVLGQMEIDPFPASGIAEPSGEAILSGLWNSAVGTTLSVLVTIAASGSTLAITGQARRVLDDIRYLTRR